MLNLTKLTKRFTPNTIKNINTKTTLYVKNVPFNISNNQIKKYFNCQNVFRPKIDIPVSQIRLEMKTLSNKLEILKFLRDYNLFYLNNRVKVDRSFYGKDSEDEQDNTDLNVYIYTNVRENVFYSSSQNMRDVSSFDQNVINNRTKISLDFAYELVPHLRSLYHEIYPGDSVIEFG